MPTIRQWHIRARLLLDKVDSKAVPSFETNEMDDFFNMAIKRYVLSRYKEFEVNQRRTDDLRGLVKEVNISRDSPSLSLYPNADSYTLPVDYMFSISERPLISSYKNSCGNTVTNKIGYLRAIQHDDFEKLLKDPFNKPQEKEVLRLIQSNKIILVHDENTVLSDLVLSYIKNPIEVQLDLEDENNSINSDMPEHTHDEIIQLAVQIILETISDPRFQTNSILVAEQK